MIRNKIFSSLLCCLIAWSNVQQRHICDLYLLLILFFNAIKHNKSKINLEKIACNKPDGTNYVKTKKITLSIN